MSEKSIAIRVAVDIGNNSRPKDDNFLKVFPAFFSSFLEELKIDDGKARLVLFLMHEASKMPLNSDSAIFLEHKEVAKVLGISRRTLFRYLREIEKATVIRQYSPRSPVYWINPEMFYRGSLKHRKASKYYEKFSANMANGDGRDAMDTENDI